MEIRQELHDVLPELARVRRELHRIPEEGFREEETSAFIYDYLKALSPDSLEHIAGTGVKAVFTAKEASRTTAFRADMDALPLTEATGLPFASCHKGYMHACGHDAHMAVALTTALLAARHREELDENVVVLFQPSEEGGCGAVRMIEAGALETPHVDRIFGLHVFPGLEKGRLGVRSGPLMARASSIDIAVFGKSAHGAKPHLGNDAIVAAAQLVTMLETLVSRRIDPMDDAVFTIGVIKGGVKRNVICDEVRLCCTMRTFTDETYEAMMRGINGMLHAIEDAFSVRTELSLECEDYLAVVNDEELAAQFAAAAGDAACDVPRVCIGEDFSFYQRRTKGFFAFAGVGEDVSALHTPTMFFEEDALLYALETYMRLLGL